MSYNFEYVSTQPIDEENKVVIIKCENFLYYVRCFQNIIQYVHGEWPETYNLWQIPPTKEEATQHDAREEIFNQDHSIIQTYLDSQNEPIV